VKISFFHFITLFIMSTTQQEHQLNYEELGAAAAKLDHAAVTQAAQAMSAPTAGAAIVPPQVCNLYKKVKPFLSLIGSIPFIPSSIKVAIKAFSSGMNLLCP
jgi:hypothetical protein